MDLFVAALAGGAVGTLVALFAFVPQEVRAHERRLIEYDEDLAQWIADEVARLERETRKRGDAHTVAALREDLLYRYRDQERRARRKRTALRDAEGWRHTAWRWLTGRGELGPLRTPGRARGVINSWREPVTMNGASAPVEDPLDRSLDRVLADRSSVSEDALQGAESTPDRTQEHSG